MGAKPTNMLKSRGRMMLRVVVLMGGGGSYGTCEYEWSQREQTLQHSGGGVGQKETCKQIGTATHSKFKLPVAGWQN